MSPDPASKAERLEAICIASAKLMNDLDLRRHEAEMAYISATRARAEALEEWVRAVEAVIAARKASEYIRE